VAGRGASTRGRSAPAAEVHAPGDEEPPEGVARPQLREENQGHTYERGTDGDVHEARPTVP